MKRMPVTSQTTTEIRTMDFFTDDTDLFEALGIKEEWEEEEISDAYAEQDARTLKEYGF